MYPALRRFVEDALGAAPLVAKEVDSFLKLCKVCDLIRLGTRCRSARPAQLLADRLEQASVEYLEAFKLAHGVEILRFKHHQLLHLPGQLRRDGFLLTCWALERKHIGAKAACNHFKQADAMTAGMLPRMLNEQVCFYIYGSLIKRASSVSLASISVPSFPVGRTLFMKKYRSLMQRCRPLQRRRPLHP